MKKFLSIIIILALANLTGCVTSTTLDYATGTRNGKENAHKPHPEAYALLPFAVIADIPTLPFWVIVTIAVNVQIAKFGIQHSSTPKPNATKQPYIKA